MLMPLNELDTWDGLTTERRLAIATAVADQLGRSFHFDGLRSNSLGGQSHEIAFYTFEDSSFALIPGQSAATLGYDKAVPFQPTQAQAEDWEFTEEEYGYTLSEYLDYHLTPQRRITILPFLIEVHSRSHGYNQDGDDQAKGYVRIQSMLGEGFRLPTADEWEYVCAAGTRSLFRWGNDCPISCSSEEKEWDLHRRPNAFGLVMNTSTYESELCQGPILRGGDGGGSVCGGEGNVASWLPLASSFQVPAEDTEGWWIEAVLVRRVRSVAATNAV